MEKSLYKEVIAVEFNLREIKNTIFNSKEYFLIYVIFISIAFLSTITQNNIYHPKFELISFVVILLLGCLTIVFFLLNNNDKDLYKVVFVVIVCFGIISSLLIPIGNVSDETEHFVRSEITSQGIIFPHWTGDDLGVTRTFDTNGNFMSNDSDIGFHTIASSKFIYEERGLTVFETSHDCDKINYTEVIASSAFQQNIFYSYFPQAIGILIAKLLDLNVMWMLWLARIFNLLFYAGLISYAVKKTPYLKIPLFAVSCIPITIFQASSVSIDSLVFGLGILSVAYFIYMCQSEDKSLNIKQIGIFSIVCLLLGLCKLPYLAFIFLLLFVPKEKFENEDYLKYILISIICVAIIGILWSNFATPAIMHSWRSKYDINSTLQLHTILNNSNLIFIFLSKIFNSSLDYLTNGLFNFFNYNQHPLYNDNYYLISFLLQIFLVLVLFAYPDRVNFNFKSKIGVFGVVLLIYVGTCFVQLLSWANVGKTNLGISIRYFIPLFALIPIIFRINTNERNWQFDNYVVIFIIGFLSAMVLSFVTKYY